jgi:hypothetical protein
MFSGRRCVQDGIDDSVSGDFAEGIRLEFDAIGSDGMLLAIVIAEDLYDLSEVGMQVLCRQDRRFLFGPHQDVGASRKQNVCAVYVELRRGNTGDVSLDVRLLCETGDSEADESGGDEQTRSHFVRSVIPELVEVNVVMKGVAPAGAGAGACAKQRIRLRLLPC